MSQQFLRRILQELLHRCLQQLLQRFRGIPTGIPSQIDPGVHPGISVEVPLGIAPEVLSDIFPGESFAASETSVGINTRVSTVISAGVPSRDPPFLFKNFFWNFS